MEGRTTKEEKSQRSPTKGKGRKTNNNMTNPTQTPRNTRVTNLTKTNKRTREKDSNKWGKEWTSKVPQPEKQWKRVNHNISK